MISVEKALKTILINVKTLNSETVKFTDSLDRVIAKDIYSGINVPAFDNSAMDGYAVRSCDTTGASGDKPKVLEVVGEIKAGKMPKKTLKKREAVRIMTGAPMPKGADSVVIVEHTKQIRHCEEAVGRLLHSSLRGLRSRPKQSKVTDSQQAAQSLRLLRPFGARNDTVEIYKQAKIGENVRRTGEDVKKSELVMPKGTLLKPSLIGILASLGMAKVEVIRRPKVAILVTGDEIVDVGGKLEPGKVRSSNTYTMHGQVLKC